MAIRFAESFDWAPFSGFETALAERQYTVTGGPSRGVGRIGGFSFSGSGQITEFASSCSRSLEGSYTSGFFGVSLNFLTALPTNENRIIRLRSGATTQLALRVEPDGRVTILRDATVLATSAARHILVGAWHRVEIGFTISDTLGAYEVRVGGVTAVAATNVDTRNGAPLDIDNFALSMHGASSSFLSFDDVTFNDTVGGAPQNTFMGDLQIEPLRPNSNVLSTWTASLGTSNFDMVDEAVRDTSDFVSAASPLVDRYGLTDMVGTPVTIFGVQAFYHARKTATGTCTMHSQVISGASIGSGATRGLVTNGIVYTDIFEVDPQGGGAWTSARVNAAQIGIERVS